MSRSQVEKVQDAIAQFLKSEGWSVIEDRSNATGNIYTKLFPSSFSCQYDKSEGITVRLEEAFYICSDKADIFLDLSIDAKSVLGKWVTLNFNLTPIEIHKNLDQYTSSLIAGWEAVNKSPDSNKEI
jgi:hypothetical protein